jgi:hypothetical protein
VNDKLSVRLLLLVLNFIFVGVYELFLFRHLLALLLCNDLHFLPADGRMHTKSHVFFSCFKLLPLHLSGSLRGGLLCRKQSSLAMYQAVERGSPNTTDYRIYLSEL